MALLILISMLPLQAFAAETYQPAEWKFRDVAAEWWAFPYIKLLYDSEVIDGTSATTFDLAAYVTRAQFVKMLGCAAGVNTADYTAPAF